MLSQQGPCKAIIPKGTAPDDPAVSRNKFRRNMMEKTILGEAISTDIASVRIQAHEGKTIAVRRAVLRLFIPPNDA